MKESGSGTISRIGNNSKSFQMQETEDKWFGAFNMSQLQDAKVGDKVEFFYESRTKDGRTFHNISGNIKKVATAESTGSSSVTPTSALLPPPLSRERLILRQNALTNAVNAMALVMKEGGSFSKQECLAMAKDFERYTSGDGDNDNDEGTSNEEVVALKAAQ